jgi:XTP/dITP diphosphohydrolase
MQQLLLATRNRHKTREFSELLGAEFTIHDLNSCPNFCDLPETGSTFEENAIAKALTASRQVGGLVVADDSGLEVDALGGAPGIFSARYSGEGRGDQANVEKLLRELERAPTPVSRRAQFCCALALARDGKLLGTFEGTVKGIISVEAAGSSGFGYDPVFVPDGFDRTFAELSPATKNKISHRTRAIKALRERLAQLR